MSIAEMPVQINHSDAEFAAFREWLAGFTLYMDGGFLIDCRNDRERRGWEAAERAAAQFAAAATPRYTTDGYMDEPAIEDDYEWIRMGC